MREKRRWRQTADYFSDPYLILSRLVPYSGPYVFLDKKYSNMAPKLSVTLWVPVYIYNFMTPTHLRLSTYTPAPACLPRCFLCKEISHWKRYLRWKCNSWGSQKFCNILVTLNLIRQIWMLLSMSWKWGTMLHLEMPNSPDTLWMILNGFVYRPWSTISNALSFLDLPDFALFSRYLPTEWNF